MIDFCKPYPDRLHAAAHIPALDVEEAVKELRRVAGLGVKSAMLISAAPDGLAFGNPRFDPLWAEAQEIGIPISFHPTGSFTSIGNRFYPTPEVSSVWWIYVISSDEVKYQFTSLLNDGVLEKCPELKIVLLESGVGWLAFGSTGWTRNMRSTASRPYEDAAQRVFPASGLDSHGTRLAPGQIQHRDSRRGQVLLGLRLSPLGLGDRALK